MLREMADRDSKLKHCLLTTFLHEQKLVEKNSKSANVTIYNELMFGIWAAYRQLCLSRLWNDRKYMMNSFLKCIIFAQDVHETIEIDNFVNEDKDFFYFLYPKKYHWSVLRIAEVLFQGSATDGTCLFNENIIKNNSASKVGENSKLKTQKTFDIDIMYVVHEETKMAAKTDAQDVDDVNDIYDQVIYVSRIEDQLGLNPDFVKLRSKLNNFMIPEFFAQLLIPAIFRNTENESFDHPYAAFLCQRNCNLNDTLCLKCKLKNAKLIRKKNSKVFINMESVGFSGPAVTSTLKIKTQLNMTADSKMIDGEDISRKNTSVNIDNDTFPWISPEGTTYISVDHVLGYPFPHSRFGGRNGGRWPLWALEYFIRDIPSGWPSLQLLFEIVQNGCHIDPKKGDCAFDNLKGFPVVNEQFRNLMKVNPLQDPMWRVSFAQAEKTLAKSFNSVQRRCYLFSKFILSQFQKEINNDRDLMSGGFERPWTKDCQFESHVNSYLLKQVMFWVMEETPAIEWRENNMLKCISLVLHKFRSSILGMHFPHYFLGKQKNLLDPGIRRSSSYYDETHLTVFHHRLKKMMSLYFPAIGVSTDNDAELFTFLFSRICYGIRNNEFNLFSQNVCNLHETFEKLALALTSPQSDSDLKSNIIEHYQKLVDFILSAPHVYGTGVNKTRIKFIEDELKLLKTKSLCDLDELEELEIQNRIKTVPRKGDGDVDDLFKLQVHALKQEKSNPESVLIHKII